MHRRDLDKARSDLAAFAKLVGWPLTKWQAAAFALLARTTYVLGPRQSGKSRSVAVTAAWRAYREPGHHVLIVSASELGSRRLLAMIADLVVNSPVLSASVVDEQASLIRLTNGSPGPRRARAAPRFPPHRRRRFSSRGQRSPASSELASRGVPDGRGWFRTNRAPCPGQGRLVQIPSDCPDCLIGAASM
jgi:hypothetical protein